MAGAKEAFADRERRLKQALRAGAVSFDEKIVARAHLQVGARFTELGARLRVRAGLQEMRRQLRAPRPGLRIVESVGRINFAKTPDDALGHGPAARHLQRAFAR